MASPTHIYIPHLLTHSTDGDEIAFEWRVDRNIPAADYPLKDGTIPVGVTDDSHKGPCAVYMKKVNDASTAVGAGDGWFKVTDEGLTDGVFCTDRLRLANAPQPGSIPHGIAPGDYLMRAEFLTLNNAGATGARQPQFYAGCVQVAVSGTTGALTPDTVSIPGYVNIDTPGLIWDIWNSPNGRFSNYPMVGPAPVTDSSVPAPAQPGAPIPSAPSIPSVSAPGIPPVSTPAVAYPTAIPTPTAGYSPPVSGSVSAPAVSKSSVCNVKIVTATTFITITSTRAYADPTDTPENDDSVDADADDSPPQPTYGHGGHGAAHGSRRRRS